MSDPVAAAIWRHLHSGQLAFDIGANRGHYTRLMAATGARVVAFEPNPDVQDALGTRRAAEVEIVQAAVSDTEGEVTFFLDRRPGLNGMASSLLRLDGMDGAPQITVPAVTIDRFCADRQLRPDFIKIDAEGAEPMILAGAHATVEQFHPVLVFEMWETHWPRYRELISWLAATYDISRLSDGAAVPATYIDAACAGVADILAIPRTANLLPYRKYRPYKLWRHRIQNQLDRLRGRLSR